MKSLVTQFQGTMRNWWIYECLGILCLLLSLFVFSHPLSSYAGLVLYFVSMFIVSGGMRVYFALTNRDQLQNWGWYLAGGILDLMLGLILMGRLDIAGMTLPFFVGFYLMFGSISAIGKSFDLRSFGLNWGGLLATGIAGLIFSILILFNPTLGVSTVVVWTSLAFFMLGVFYIYLGFSLRRMGQRFKSVMQS